MNILHVIPYLNPKRGGDVYVCHMQCKYLQKKGHQTSILTTSFDVDREFINTIKLDGIQVYVIPFLFQFSMAIFSPQFRTWVNKNINQYDLVHLHNFRTIQNIISAKAANQFHIPFIVQPHGDIQISDKKILKNIFNILYGKEILKKAAGIFTLTQTEKELLSYYNVDSSKISIIPNGVEVSAETLCKKKGLFKETIGLNPGNRIILFIGRLHETKGLKLILDSFRQIRLKCDSIKIVIIGPDYGYGQTLTKLIQDYQLNDDIFVLNFVENNTKFQAYCDSDIFITPTYSGFPITFLEACSVGLPIITTCLGDKLDWINGKVGFVVEPNEFSIGYAIEQLINDYVLRQKFGENGKKLVRENFSWEKIVEMLEREYKNLCIQ